MIIKEIELKDFRNYESLNLKFHNRVNIFLGDNAQGKTNILEAVYLTALGKSFRTARDAEMIRFGSEFLKVKAIAQKYDDYQGAKAYFSQTDQSDSSKLMDNHEYFERFSELSKTETFQNALVNKGATLGFTPIDIKKYVESSRLQQLRNAVEKNNEKEKQEDNEIEK